MSAICNQSTEATLGSTYVVRPFWRCLDAQLFIATQIGTLPGASSLRHGALKNQVQHFSERMLHGKKLQSVEY